MLSKKLQLLEKQINLITEDIKRLPQGHLVFAKNGPYTKWYRSRKKNFTYIPKKDIQLAEALALKKYYTLQLEELKQEYLFLKQYLDTTNLKSKKSAQLLNEASDYYSLLKAYFNSYSQPVREWISCGYPSNPNYPEHLIHKTLAGHFVRSKSEVIIANALYLNHIPYRYECSLVLNDITIYPDFTILHPHTMNEVYWEHFGKMDSPSYIEQTYQKLRTYGNNGIIPSINLITTYETAKNPIASDYVEQLIQQYFS